ncbi:uncharacterized protein LAESUDRAFT_521162 [Laetiporus sulphureus 93-53]|uniref:Uncharacterized protein n=1 Tax=Laetiporus sulphureus 93-53 TaxID=1314785 RepID=A0A165G454_9APHY|nr:uncharacterized protein LAESUDRAFT_521162 [Laetiporus sulphureus 93-53]KZT09803.1 hypothetical protein LAESUDRAFT_521162 [Laetiporus sulphureus 93-53]
MPLGPYSLGMEVHVTMPTNERANLLDRLDDARLVAHGHDGNQCRVWPNGLLHLSEVDDTVLCRRRKSHRTPLLAASGRSRGRVAFVFLSITERNERVQVQWTALAPKTYCRVVITRSFLSLWNRATPLIAMLYDSVAPEVNTMSFESAAHLFQTRNCLCLVRYDFQAKMIHRSICAEAIRPAKRKSTERLWAPGCRYWRSRRQPRLQGGYVI